MNYKIVKAEPTASPLSTEITVEYRDGNVLVETETFHIATDCRGDALHHELRGHARLVQLKHAESAAPTLDHFVGTEGGSTVAPDADPADDTRPVKTRK